MITDSFDDHQYAGGQYGTRQRWVADTETGHGGNNDLTARLRKHGAAMAFETWIVT
ncbi:MAG: hypothetical protein GY758_24385 [Fuerstiella sp.]|nr:hypothetical protein [Fuerstiella sp.]MCP4505706.1 hypothetical protein [Fuerstiella sp.]MDG2130611.1 hypothetical protein [Fuerstiella sp.]